MINPECPVHKEGGPKCICAGGEKAEKLNNTHKSAKEFREYYVPRSKELDMMFSCEQAEELMTKFAEHVALAESSLSSTKGEQNGLSVSVAGNAQPSDADSVLKLDDGVAPSLSSPPPINPYKYAFEFVRNYLGLPKESPDDGEDLKKQLPIMRDAIRAAFPKPTHKNGDVK